jgi:hypothetical protein
MDNAEGYVSLDQVQIDGVETQIPVQLLNGGNHFNDVPQVIRRRNSREPLSNTLPRTQLLMKVINSNMDRPSSNIQRRPGLDKM